jgi:hypothetical protein
MISPVILLLTALTIPASSYVAYRDDHLYLVTGYGRFEETEAFCQEIGGVIPDGFKAFHKDFLIQLYQGARDRYSYGLWVNIEKTGDNEWKWKSTKTEVPANLWLNGRRAAYENDGTYAFGKNSEGEFGLFAASKDWNNRHTCKVDITSEAGRQALEAKISRFNYQDQQVIENFLKAFSWMLRHDVARESISA